MLTLSNGWNSFIVEPTLEGSKFPTEKQLPVVRKTMSNPKSAHDSSAVPVATVYNLWILGDTTAEIFLQLL